MRFIVDTSAWIEYLEGSKSGEKVNDVIKKHEVYTISLIISEVTSKIKRKNGNSEIAYDCIIKNSKVFEITPKIAKKAGLMHAELKPKMPGFSIADALIICSAEAIGAKVATKDEHFKGFKGVVFV